MRFVGVGGALQPPPDSSDDGLALEFVDLPSAAASDERGGAQIGAWDMVAAGESVPGVPVQDGGLDRAVSLSRGRLATGPRPGVAGGADAAIVGGKGVADPEVGIGELSEVGKPLRPGF